MTEQIKQIKLTARRITHMEDVAEEVKDMVDDIKRYFGNNGVGKNAIIGISGGKDSTIAAALCVRALGSERVIGVLMPNGEQPDIDDARKVCEYLGIKSVEVNIGETVEALYSAISYGDCCGSHTVLTNTPARIRMATLYAVSALYNGRVICTCNKSEKYVGWTTKWGDVGDYAPLANFTVHDLYVIGEQLNLPPELLYKTPADGMTGRSDEANFGFTYAELDNWIINHESPSIGSLEKICEMNRRSIHKRMDGGIPGPGPRRDKFF